MSDKSQKHSASADYSLRPCSQLTGRASGSRESTQDNMHANGGSRGLLSEEGDEGSQQEQSEISDDEEDLRAAKSVKPAYKRGRKVSPFLSSGCYLTRSGKKIPCMTGSRSFADHAHFSLQLVSCQISCCQANCPLESSVQ